MIEGSMVIVVIYGDLLFVVYVRTSEDFQRL
jgi:hypothetical protein